MTTSYEEIISNSLGRYPNEDIKNEYLGNYEDLLYYIQCREEYVVNGDDNTVTKIPYPQIGSLLPAASQVYEVDLNSRQVNTPSLLSVQFDHNAEIIYFKCPRYYDNMDLTQAVCVIEFLNAEHLAPGGKKMVRDAGLFWVPFYDINHYDVEIDENGNQIAVPIMYFPWSIGGLATKYSGKITFAIRFYQLANVGQEDSPKYEYLYNLSTRPKDGEIVHGLDLSEEELDAFKLEPNVVQEIYRNLSLAKEDATTYWLEL